MAYGERNDSSFLESFSLSPLPYPVLLILLVVLLLLGSSWYFTYEPLIEDVEEQMSWLLFVIPVALILLIRWLSSIDNVDGLFGFTYPSSYGRPRWSYFGDQRQEGSSPWGVAAVVVLLLVMVSFQSSFLEMWKA